MAYFAPAASLLDGHTCPKCGETCLRHEVDIGVGIQCGPWGCWQCGWSEDSTYDQTAVSAGPDANGGYKDQFGAYHPARSKMAKAYRLATK